MEWYKNLFKILVFNDLKKYCTFDMAIEKDSVNNNYNYDTKHCE